MDGQRYYGFATKVYGATVDGHDVAIEFDKKLVVLNRVRLHVDGELVDSGKVFYGDKTLTADLGDGTRVTVVVDSGMGGELTRAQAQRADGAWVTLEERTTQSA